MADIKDFQRVEDKLAALQEAHQSKPKAFGLLGFAFLTLLSLCIFLGLSDDKKSLANAAGGDIFNQNIGFTSAQNLADLKRSSLYLKGDSGQRAQAGPLLFPPPVLESVALRVNPRGALTLTSLPDFTTRFGGKVAGRTQKNDFIFYTLDPVLQVEVEKLVAKTRAPHVAIVAMDPKSGRVLAIADKSSSVRNLSLHAGLPAASIFKIVTAAAAVERANLEPDSVIKYRGGTYILNQWNYKPNPRADKRSMSVSEALGKSCNPVFSHIALRFLNAPLMRHYAKLFGFNNSLKFDVPLPASTAVVPDSDYELGRTAAGFGEVRMTPVHAAALMAGIANQGVLSRPILIDRVVTPEGEVVYNAHTELLGRIVEPDTAETVLEMLESTVTVGTARKEFTRKSKPVLPGIKVAAKTGTLRGSNPSGINNWFVAAAPVSNPQIAISVVVVNPPGSYSHASQLGKEVLREFFGK